MTQPNQRDVRVLWAFLSGVSIVLAAPRFAALADEASVVRGQVLLPDGKPAEGADLYWLHFNVPEPKTPEDVSYAQRGVTDAAGRFELKFEEGDAPLKTMRPLFAYKSGNGVEWIAVGPGEVPADVTLKLREDHPIRGRVIDTEGRAVAGAHVAATHVSGASEGNLDVYLEAWKKRPQQARRTLDRQFLFLHAIGPALAAVTDEHGRFELLGVGVERVALVHISGQGIVQAEFNIINREQFDPTEFNQAAAANQFPRMRAPGMPSELSGPVIEHVAEAELVVRGTVFTGPDHKPVADANVSSFGNGNYNITTTRTDEAGRFELRGLRRREGPKLQVRFPRGGKFLFRAVELDVPLGQTAINVDVEVKEGVVVEGRVFDKTTGRGVRSSVQFVPLPGNQNAEPKRPAISQAANQTDDEGRFRMLVMPGPGVLLAQMWSDGPRALGPQPGGNEPKPYRQATFSEEDGERVPVTVDGENRYFADAYGRGQALTRHNAVKVIDSAPGSEPVTCDLPLDPGKTATIAIEDEQGKPVAGAIVSGVADVWPIAFEITEPRCTIYGLGADRPRHVSILHPGRHLATSFDMTGDEPGPVTVRLGAAASIVGRALDPDGKPLADAQVQIYYPRRSAQELMNFMDRDKTPLKTDADGRFRVENVPPGERLSLGLRQGDTFYGGPRITDEKRQLKPGEQLDLGEFKAKETQ